MLLTAPRTVALLEACYRVEPSEERWLRGLLETTASSFAGARGVSGWVYTVHGGRVAVRTAAELQPGQVAMIARMHSSYQEMMHERLERRFFCGAGSEAIEPSRVAEALRGGGLEGVGDFWAVDGHAGQSGVVLGASSERALGPTDAGLRQLWQAAAVHLSAALRLRSGMMRGRAPSEGVLSPDGRAVHAEGPARGEGARRELQQAARGIERARRRHRQRPGEALEAWQALVAGRWTLVEHEERDGRRYLLARVNEPEAPAGGALARRERQVVELLADGHSLKEASYALGLTLSTVSGYAQRAARKLGASSRVELVRRWRLAQPR